jgi:hypothetical protein
MSIWHTSVVPERAPVNSPVSRGVLLELFDKLNEILSRRRRHCTNTKSVFIRVFTTAAAWTECKSCHGFFDMGGLIISTTIAEKWHSREHILLDMEFWDLWDTIVMCSGWGVVEISSFRSLYNISADKCNSIIPLLPNLHVTKEAKVGLVIDPLSYHSTGFDLFGDILRLFTYFIKSDIWGVGSKMVHYSKATSCYIDYQFKLLDIMINRRSKPSDVLDALLDLNEWGVCLSSLSSYPVQDNDFNSKVTIMMMVMRSSLMFSHTAKYCENINKYNVRKLI